MRVPGRGMLLGAVHRNSMNCLSEALGMSLPGNGTIPAVDPGRFEAREGDRRRCDGLVRRGHDPGQDHDPGRRS